MAGRRVAQDRVVVVSPAGRPDGRIVVGACRAGALGVLDLGGGSGLARAELRPVQKRYGGTFGVRIATETACAVSLPPAVTTLAMSESLHLDLRNVHSSVGVSVLCPEWIRGTRIHDAERNLPSTARTGAAGEGSPLVDGVLRSLVNGGTDPDDLAGEVVGAIRGDRFWVLPHRSSTLEAAQLRWAAIAEDRPPPTWDFGVRARSSAPGSTGEKRGRRRRTESAPLGPVGPVAPGAAP